MTPLMEGGEVIEALGDRVLGRVALEDIRDPFTGEVIVKANQEINEELVKRIEDAGLERVKIRSVLTCAVAPRRVHYVLRPRPRRADTWSIWVKRSASSRLSRSANRARS